MEQLTERSKARANVKESTLIGEGSYDFRLLDDVPGLWILSCIVSKDSSLLFLQS